jgi:hypothetical protein
MLKAFEHWFGPYPFYEDSFKLVEAPYLGMEHQSSVTYGTALKRISRKDLSGTGWGLKFDFIIIQNPDMNGLLIISLIKISQICGFTKVSLNSESLFVNIIMEKKLVLNT